MLKNQRRKEEINRLRTENEVLKRRRNDMAHMLQKLSNIEGKLELMQETIVENNDRLRAEMTELRAELLRQNTDVNAKLDTIIALLRPTAE